MTPLLHLGMCANARRVAFRLAAAACLLLNTSASACRTAVRLTAAACLLLGPTWAMADPAAYLLKPTRVFDGVDP